MNAMNEHVPLRDTAPDAAEPSRHAVPRRPGARVAFAVLLAVLAAAGLWLVGSRSDAPAPNRAPAPSPVVVRTELAKRDSLELTSRYHGELGADAAEIAARTGGLLEHVAVRIGDEVRAGQLLGRIDTAQLTRQVAEAEARRRGALASRKRVMAELVAARAAFERTVPLLEQKLISPQDQEELRARVAALEAERDIAAAQADEAQARKLLLRQQIDDARLVAPFDGAVAERHLDAGAVVQLGTPVLTLVKAGPLRVQFRVPERDLGRIRVGQPFALTTQATGPTQFHGALDRIAAAVAREDRSVAVEGTLAKAEPALRAGMYAEITVQLGRIDDASTLPGNAVVERPGEGGELAAGVFRVEDGLARWTPVRVLGREGDRVALSGLPEGARVITGGQERVQDGARVQVVGGDA